MSADVMERSAVLSADGRRRYTLGRRWATKGPDLLWIMLNPSTADADVDDPTIRRCIGFSQRLGYASLTVVNLYAVRATNPRHLTPQECSDQWGVNCEVLEGELATHTLAVAAWGAWSRMIRPPVEVYAAQCGTMLRSLGVTKNGSPRHPLYVKGNTSLSLWPA